MSEVKGRMLLVSVTRTLQLAVALAVLDVVAGALLGIDLSPVVAPAIQALWAALIAQGTVFLAWNAVSGATAVYRDAVDRECRKVTAQPERPRGQEEASQASAARVHPAYAAMRRAAMAGTLSVNGVRCDAAHLSGPGSLSGAGGRVPRAGLGTSGRISKSECDGCGAPLDVAWCAPGVLYLCPGCREQEFFPCTSERT